MSRLFLAALALPGARVWAIEEPIQENGRFPVDVTLMKGAQRIRANVDECLVEMSLQAGEIFASSNETHEAIFYKPSGKFSVKSAPYLYKPDVERYSDIAWSYKKPEPTNEPWFGMKCSIGNPPNLSEPYFSMNCPAR